MALVLLLLAIALPTAARADFGIAEADVSFTDAAGLSADLAGSHPVTWTTSVTLNTNGSGEPEGSVRTLRVQLPPGLIAVLTALPTCSHAAFDAHSCPPASAIGALTAKLSGIGTAEPSLYALTPSPGAAAEFGLSAAGLSAFVRLTIATAAPHNVVATFANVPAAFTAATLTVDGTLPGGSFLVMPRVCTPALSTRIEAESVEQPGVWDSIVATTHDNAVVPNPIGLGSCDLLQFSPSLSVAPTAVTPGTPTGLDLTLDAPNRGYDSNATAEADLSRAELTLPEGMTLNPPAAAGLDACTPAQLDGETPDAPPGAGCPPASKVGTALVTTPLFSQSIAGTVYVAQPDDPATPQSGAENPFDSLLALYLVLRDPERGVLLSLPIRLDPDPESGRLTADLDQIPQLPFSHLSLRFDTGPHAPLVMPRACGSSRIAFELTPSSGNPPLGGSDAFTVTGPDCVPAFAPTLSAGTVSNAAGRSAAFVLELQNPAASPNLSALSLTLPPGLSADLAHTATCPEPATATATCPPDSRLGYARIALGSGPDPLWAPSGADPDSAVYLAGPYKGAPYSLLISVPAKAGPYDLGTVIVRATLSIDPSTAQASVALDPLPQILHGVPLHYRTIRLVLDRPGLIRNPTSCEPGRIVATATSATSATVGLGSRFQAADCAALDFKPRLTVRLSGGLRRNAHPRIDIDLIPRAAEANLAAATFTLPAGELLDLKRIRALCARTLAPEECPRESRLGHARLLSPLLPDALQGDVYMRVPSGRYPDLFAELRAGRLHVLLHGRTAAAPGGGLRVDFTGLPDLPLTKASIALDGGRSGIFVNSEALCARQRRAAATLSAQNGKQLRLRPLLRLPGSC